MYEPILITIKHYTVQLYLDFLDTKKLQLNMNLSQITLKFVTTQAELPKHNDKTTRLQLGFGQSKNYIFLHSVTWDPRTRNFNRRNCSEVALLLETPNLKEQEVTLVCFPQFKAHEKITLNIWTYNDHQISTRLRSWNN